MKTLLTILIALATVISASADRYSYSFNGTPISEAILKISKDHPDLSISFIYKDLHNYKTSAIINTNNPYDALRQTIGLNPVTIIKKGTDFYVEALQHGKFHYAGRAIGSDHMPVVAATVMLLAPKDSTIITYGITDDAGRFSIPCDRKEVIAKLTCLGYSPEYKFCDSFSIGTIMMKELPVRLQTLKVNADEASVYSDKSVYRPTQRQKDVAQTANDLLLHMAIPQLSVDPTTLAVKTTNGQPVSIFIDGVSATPQDLSGMQTNDVKKVEFLLNPQDVRFKGAPYVVNFIMQKYEWGGYTKLSADKWFAVNRSEGSVYSKFVYKKMTLDLSASDTYFTSHHDGSRFSETFRFTDLYGQEPQNVDRKSDLISSLSRNNNSNISLRVLYATDNTQISNLTQINGTSTPCNDQENLLSYANGFIPTTTSRSIASNKSFTIYDDLNIYRILSSKIAFNIELEYHYSYNRLNSYYTNESLKIINNATENYHHIKATPCLVWNLNQHNSIVPFMLGEYAPSAIDYYGNSPSKQKYDIIGYMAGVRYTHRQDKWTAGGLIGWVYGYTNLTGVRKTESFPRGDLSGTYSPDRKNQLEIRYAFGKNVPDTYLRSPNMLQQDELMWYAGTPKLDNSWHQNITFSYTWLPNKVWRLNVYGNCFIEDNRVVPVYTPTGPEGTMLRKYQNNGNYRYATLGINGTASFLNGKLIARLGPYFCRNYTTGEYLIKENNPFCTAQLTWYFDNFYLFGWYSTPLKNFSSNAGYTIQTPSRYQIQIGWGKGAWRASATAYNFLRTSWEDNRYTLNGQYYSYDQTYYGSNQHMRFQLSATYTFGYGKKLQTGNEINGTVSTNSAILK